MSMGYNKFINSALIDLGISMWYRKPLQKGAIEMSWSNSGCQCALSSRLLENCWPSSQALGNQWAMPKKRRLWEMKSWSEGGETWYSKTPPSKGGPPLDGFEVMQRPYPSHISHNVHLNAILRKLRTQGNSDHFCDCRSRGLVGFIRLKSVTRRRVYHQIQ